MTDTQHLTAELESAALHALSDEYEGLNQRHFKSMLRAPVLSLTDTTHQLGRWTATGRSLALSRALLLGHPWGVVVEVLKHEMAHQYVDEVLGVRDQTAHGPVFQKVCTDRGIDASAQGVPDPRGPTDAQRAVLEKVAKLLALAQSPNENESQAAMNAAQRLMLKHNLDAVQTRALRGYSFRQLGEALGRLEESISLIGSILSDHFFVEVIQVRVWRVREGRPGTVLEVSGTPENLAMAEYVYSFLHHTAEALWAQHKRRHGIRGDKDRRAYRAGVMQGFLDKLRAQQKSQQELGMVWAGDPALHRFYRQRHPWVRSTRTGGYGDHDARNHGREAGRKLVLHKGMDGAATSRGRQLGDGR